MDTDTENRSGTEATLPERVITANQVVAWNLARYRRAAGWTQGRLAAELGWTEDKVSDAERSWHSGRTREFNAQELVIIAVALGVPVVALLVPPGTDGHEETLRVPLPNGEALGMDEYMAEAVMPDSDSDTPACDTYRDRYKDAVVRYLDPEWHERGKQWVTVNRSPQAIADATAWLRDRQRELADMAAGMGQFAAGMEEGGAAR